MVKMESNHSSSRNIRIGKWGEEYAVQLMEEKGYQLLARNERTPYGELDIIARKDGMIVFVEVKTRFSSSFGPPEIAISKAKKQHLINAAEAYLQAHPEIDTNAWQLDVISISRDHADSDPTVTWFENAVS